MMSMADSSKDSMVSSSIFDLFLSYRLDEFDICSTITKALNIIDNIELVSTDDERSDG